MFILFIMALSISISFGVPRYLKDCMDKAIHIGDFIYSVESYTGKAYKVYLRKRKKTGKCLYTVKGERGTAVVDAETGEIIKFYKRR